jgi:chromosome segregation ATPase
MEILQKDLKSPSSEFTYGGKTFSRAETATDLGNRLNAYERRETEIAEKEKQVQSLATFRDEANGAIDELVVRHSKLVAHCDTLKARLVVAQSESLAMPDDEVAGSIAAAESLAQEIEVKIAGLRSAVDLSAPAIPVNLSGVPPERRYDQLFGKDR